MNRDQILDDALAVVRGQGQGSDIIGDVIVSMSIEELRRFAGRLAVLVDWALDSDSIDELTATVELVKAHGSRS